MNIRKRRIEGIDKYFEYVVRTELLKIRQEAFNEGVKAGVKQMMDKIQKHCELGKPVLANGELYFFKDARQNLLDIIHDIDSERE